MHVCLLTLLIVTMSSWQQVEAEITFQCISNSSRASKNIFEVQRTTGMITPNDFQGSDIERIQQAIDSAKGTTTVVTIPHRNSNGTNLWKIDRAILLPGNMTVILSNCTIQLSDDCRDNMFRSDNVGEGILNPTWNHNINIIGIGDVLLKGADNPRATGDGSRKLSLNPRNWDGINYPQESYGTDAGKKDAKQTGDWRNNLILMAYVNNLKIKNIAIKNSHAWAIDCERVTHGEISDIRIYNPEHIMVNGAKKYTSNKDGIDLRFGCKYFRINNINSINGDDPIALTAIESDNPERLINGSLSSTQLTKSRWNGTEDDIEQITITNVKTNFEGVAIRATDNARIHDVVINGLISKAESDIPATYYGVSPYTLLLGGIGWGIGGIGHIYNIYTMNFTGFGETFILISAPVSNCVFMNGIYMGNNSNLVTYKKINKSRMKNVRFVNLIKQPED